MGKIVYWVGKLAHSSKLKAVRKSLFDRINWLIAHKKSLSLAQSFALLRAAEIAEGR